MIVFVHVAPHVTPGQSWLMEFTHRMINGLCVSFLQVWWWKIPTILVIPIQISCDTHLSLYILLAQMIECVFVVTEGLMNYRGSPISIPTLLWDFQCVLSFQFSSVPHSTFYTWYSTHRKKDSFISFMTPGNNTAVGYAYHVLCHYWKLSIILIR